VNNLGVTYQESADVFSRSRGSALVTAIVATSGGAVLTTLIPWFAGGETRGLMFAAFLAVAALFWVVVASLWRRILRRQRYKIGPGWIQPAVRPLALALRGRTYTIGATDIAGVWLRRQQYGTPSIWILLRDGETVDIAPPFGAPEGHESVRVFLRENNVKADITPPGVSRGSRRQFLRRGKTSVLVLVVAWAILSSFSAYFAFRGGLPVLYAGVFALSSGALVGLWASTIRSMEHHHS